MLFSRCCVELFPTNTAVLCLSSGPRVGGEMKWSGPRVGGGDEFFRWVESLPQCPFYDERKKARRTEGRDSFRDCNLSKNDISNDSNRSKRSPLFLVSVRSESDPHYSSRCPLATCYF